MYTKRNRERGKEYMSRLYKGHRIASVDPGSIAEELELESGDCLLTITGQEI